MKKIAFRALMIALVLGALLSTLLLFAQGINNTMYETVLLYNFEKAEKWKLRSDAQNNNFLITHRRHIYDTNKEDINFISYVSRDVQTNVTYVLSSGEKTNIEKTISTGKKVLDYAEANGFISSNKVDQKAVIADVTSKSNLNFAYSNKETGHFISYPILKTYKSVPGMMGTRGKINNKNSLGISISWRRRGNNFFDLLVRKDIKSRPDLQESGDRVIPGRIKSMDVWVWGGMFDYDMELHLKDFLDFHHTLPMGSLRFRGWRNLEVAIPTSIPQDEETAPRVKGLRFSYFRFFASPGERKDRFHVFLDYFTCVTDVYGIEYDGVEIEDMLRTELGEPEQKSQTDIKP